MAWFLFVDESGHDRMASPYEVLAGVAIQDRVVSDVIRRLHEAELRCFGRRYSNGPRELKGSALLKRKVFRHQDFGVDVDRADISALAHAALDDGAHADRRMLKALAQAKVSYVGSVFDICREFRCRAFASIVETDAPPHRGRRAAEGLRVSLSEVLLLPSGYGRRTGHRSLRRTGKEPESPADSSNAAVLRRNGGGTESRKTNNLGTLLRAQRPDHWHPDRGFGSLRHILGFSSAANGKTSSDGIVGISRSDRGAPSPRYTKPQRQSKFPCLELCPHHGLAHTAGTAE